MPCVAGDKGITLFASPWATFEGMALNADLWLISSHRQISFLRSGWAAVVDFNCRNRTVTTYLHWQF